MALDLGGALTQKFGPFPGWAWLLGIGAGVFLLAPKVLKGGSGSTATAPPAGTFDPASYQAGFAQGATYNYTGAQGTPAPTLPSTTGLATTPSVPQSPPNPARRGERLPAQPVRYGIGGEGRSSSIGSRSADPHAYFHPSMKQPPLYPHFVRGGVGGAAGPHQASVHAIAHAAGIHPARLLALNGRRPQKYIRIA